MPKSLKEICYLDQNLNRKVTRFAWKLQRVYANVESFEDSKHNLWVKLFEALERYDGKKPLLEFAHSAVYSSYGNMLPRTYGSTRNIKKKKQTDDVPLVGYEYLPSYDAQYDVIDARFTLEQIDRDLRQRWEKSRCYVIAQKQIEYLYNTGCGELSTFAKQSGFPARSVYYAQEIIRQVAEKYSSKAILQTGGMDGQEEGKVRRAEVSGHGNCRTGEVLAGVSG
jgi:hypothetical protein